MPLFAANSARGKGLAYKYRSAPTPNQKTIACVPPRSLPKQTLTHAMMMTTTATHDAYTYVNMMDKEKEVGVVAMRSDPDDWTNQYSIFRKKYAKTLLQMADDAEKATLSNIEFFSRNNKKYKCTPTPLIPKSTTPVRTGFRDVAEMILRNPDLKIGSDVFVAYAEARVGDTFSTSFFEELTSCPEEAYPGFTIMIYPEHVRPFQNLSPDDEDAVKSFWDKKRYDDRIIIDFMKNTSEMTYSSPEEFVEWYAMKLARKYLTWYKEQENELKSIAIAKRIKAKTPYSKSLTSATLFKSYYRCSTRRKIQKKPNNCKSSSLCQW